MLSTKLAELRKSRKSNQSGFTIIEVMIVLAIAALILLIVLLAVPALQRNSRNTQRKNEVASISSALNEHISNNNGTGPTDTTFVSNAKLNQYEGKVFYQGTLASAPTVVSPASDTPDAAKLTVDGVIVVKGAKCSATNTAVAATSRSYAILYAVEASSGNGTLQCLAN